MKKIIAAAIALAILLPFWPASYAEGEPDISARCAVVMHSGGEVIYEKNAEMRSLIASTTKLMTALVVLEHAVLDDTVTIRDDWPAVEGSSMYLLPGQQLSVRELLTGLMLVSGNDAALALAEHVSGSSDNFARLMNEKAQELGMSSTHFDNPHGLDSEDHYSTAGNLALLMDACMDNRELCEIAALRSADAGGQTIFNHNKLLSTCPGCIGGKTGYTMAAGRCLVSCCERDGTRFICVTLSAPDDWNDHRKLFDWAYSKYSDRPVLSDRLIFKVPIIGGTLVEAVVIPEEEVSVFLPRDKELVVKAELPWFDFAPISEGKAAGTVTVSCDGAIIASSRLIYRDPVERTQTAASERYPLPFEI